LKRNLKKNSFSEVQVHAIFMDYDGTIAPLNVARSQSNVTPKNLAALNQIRELIPIAIISTKDLSFLVDRTAFACAWSGLAGLETRIGDTISKARCLNTIAPKMTTALNFAITKSANEVIIEEKHDSEGKTVAFSVDWRQTGNTTNKVASEILAYCKAQPEIFTVNYEGQPFFDVFPCQIDKGKALRKLKKKLGLIDGILYLGDSDVDNSAFREANIAIGVFHEKTNHNLLCDYLVSFEDVHIFFEELFSSSLRFSKDLSKVLIEG
jgi:trehalose-phosphatase